MSIELEDIPFDHYQRYAAAASIVSALPTPAASVLEVGANRQRLLTEFLPDCAFVFSDLFDQPGMTDFVQADASALPFSDRQFDVAIALDVIEHMPVHLRAKAVSEMARVAERIVIIACPPDKPWIHAAEETTNQVWKTYFGENYPWLDEHKEFGLVDGDVLGQALLNSGYRVIRFGQGDTAIWSGLMSAHFLKEVVAEMRPLVAAADRLYNRSVFAGDRSENYYREYFIGVRHDGDLESVRGSTVMNARGDAEAASFLSSFGEQLAPIVNRILLAEKEWKASADSLQVMGKKQAYVSAEWQRTVDLLRDIEKRESHISEEWRRTADLLRHSEDENAKLSVECAGTKKALCESEEKQTKIASQWGLTAELFRGCEKELLSVRSDYQLLRQSHDQLIVKLDDDAAEHARLESEKNQIQGLLCELAGRHELSVVSTQNFTMRVGQLERRQRWLTMGAVVSVALAVAAYCLHHL